MVEEDRVVCIRFGHDFDQDCMAMDESLYSGSIRLLGRPDMERTGGRDRISWADLDFLFWELCWVFTVS
jgi:hypothetical protein